MRKQDRTGLRRFMAFGRAVLNYLDYADDKHANLTCAATKVENLMKDAQAQSKEEERDMKQRLKATAEQFRRACAEGFDTRNFQEMDELLGSERHRDERRLVEGLLIQKADELQPRSRFAKTILPLVKYCVGRELGQHHKLECAGSSRTRTGIPGSDMDMYIVSDSPVTKDKMWNLTKCLEYRADIFNAYGTELPWNPAPVEGFRCREPQGNHKKPSRIHVGWSPRRSALRLSAQDETYDILPEQPAELLPDFLQERHYNTRGNCQQLANLEENDWFYNRRGLQRGVRFTRYYCSNKYNGPGDVREWAIKQVLIRRLVHQISVVEGFEPEYMDRTGVLTFLSYCDRSNMSPGRAFGRLRDLGPAEVEID